MVGQIVSVVGARPNFMKMAPLYKEIKNNGYEQILIHTGQHYDENMSKIFFTDLEIPMPDINFNIGSGSHANQTAKIMIKFEEFCLKNKPSLVIVFGDVNSTVACSLVCAKMGIKIAHVESGLRSGDKTMPEEINRIITDQLSDILFTPSIGANNNLLNEGIDASKIFFVGNIMIDSLMNNIVKTKKSNILNELEISSKNYALLTLHRPGNVDKKSTLQSLIEIISIISKDIQIIFPVHPRTHNSFDDKLHEIINESNIKLCPPLGYIDFIHLMNCSKFVMTDSGGIQEETTALNIPCLTLRENTERPVTIEKGTNTLVKFDANVIKDAVDDILINGGKTGLIPDLWDGKTANRILEVIQSMKL